MSSPNANAEISAYRERLKLWQPVFLFIAVLLILALGVWQHFLTPTVGVFLLIPVGLGIGAFSAASKSNLNDWLPVVAPWLLPLFLVSGLLGFLIVALYRHELTGVLAAAVFVLGGLTILFACLFLASIRFDGPPRFESYWGDITGGSGGWRVSTSLTYLLAMLVFAGAASVAFLEVRAKAADGEQKKEMVATSPGGASPATETKEEKKPAEAKQTLRKNEKEPEKKSEDADN
jgi:hypothetical protein